jgi:YHS domain-containing protein
MIRYLLILAVIALVARAVWRLAGGVLEGLRGRSSPEPSALPGAHMERDPVCGTFVVRGRALTLSVGRRQLYFCSADCRDQFRARSPKPA